MVDTVRMLSILLSNFVAAGKVLVFIDSTVEGVDLPEHLMGKILIRLNIGTNFKHPLTITSKQSSIRLSFGGVEHDCKIPHKSVYYAAMADRPLYGVEIIEHTPDLVRNFEEELITIFQEEYPRDYYDYEDTDDSEDAKEDFSRKVNTSMAMSSLMIMKHPHLLDMYEDIARMSSGGSNLQAFFFGRLPTLTLSTAFEDSEDVEDSQEETNEIDFTAAKLELNKDSSRNKS